MEWTPFSHSVNMDKADDVNAFQGLGECPLASGNAKEKLPKASVVAATRLCFHLLKGGGRGNCYHHWPV